MDKEVWYELEYAPSGTDEFCRISDHTWDSIGSADAAKIRFEGSGDGRWTYRIIRVIAAREVWHA